jgi:hypothetical protein
MHTFVTEQGYPALTVERAGNGFTATQARFGYGIASQSKRAQQQQQQQRAAIPEDTVWKVPLVVAAPGGGETRVVLDGTSAAIPGAWDGVCGAQPPIVVSPRHSAFAITVYAPEILDCLIETVMLPSKGHAMERAGILHDAARAAYAGGFKRGLRGEGFFCFRVFGFWFFRVWVLFFCALSSILKF